MCRLYATLGILNVLLAAVLFGCGHDSTGDTKPSSSVWQKDADHFNRLCGGAGVQQIPYRGGVIVCRDGQVKAYR